MASFNKHRLTTVLLLITALVLVVLLFVGKGKFYVRSLQIAWDSGHIFAFWLWTHLLLTRWPGMAAKSTWRQIAICIAITVIVSVVIEAIQETIGRSFSIFDIRKNIVGCAVAIFITSPLRKQLAGTVRVLFQLVVVVAVIYELTPLGRAAIDDIIARQQFPVLCSFETPFEKDRWIGPASLQIDRDIRKQGRSSLKLIPTSKQQTRATLMYLVRDWRGFNYLDLDVYNPKTDIVNFTLGVHDDIYYQNGWQGTDRFLGYFRLDHGWNHLRISMEEILTAPEGHEMKISHIREITIWARQNGRPCTIYIDMLKLSPS
jgi:hypothetical protein